MAGAGFGIDATRCRPALDPADCRRRPNIEKPRRLTCALTRLHDRQYPDPKVLGVSLRHRRPRFCRREHTNLICEPKGIPCNFSDSHQTESALERGCVPSLVIARWCGGRPVSIITVIGCRAV